MDWALPTRPELSLKRPFLLFAIILILLVAIGVAGYRVAREGIISREWMIHTFKVQSAIQDVRLSLSKAASDRRGVLQVGDSQSLQDFPQAREEALQAIQRLRELTVDNMQQQEEVSHVEALALERLDLLQNSIDRYEQRHETLPQQTEIELTSMRLSHEIANALQAMYDSEQVLLQKRQQTSKEMYEGTVVVLIISFLLAFALLASNFYFLYGELRRRRETEKTLRAVGDSYRRLSTRLLELQDEERRKLARELHDSVGQYLALLKMNLVRMNSTPIGRDGACNEMLGEAMSWTDRTIAEIRTVSHLLHPPMLDEVGFESACRWYLDEFEKRSGIQVNLDLPEGAPRLVPETELVLFRALQEGLTNVHRHSGARKVDVHFSRAANDVTLTLRDYGHGMSPEALQRFQSGIGIGVGLAGMRERVAELGGIMKIDSDSRGTAVQVSLPAVERKDLQAGAA
jgi:signal transduction histidine kinase